MSSSALKPSGPAAMLVGIPRKMCCWEFLSDFLDFLLGVEFIVCKGQEARIKVADPQHQTSYPPDEAVGVTTFKLREEDQLRVDNSLGLGDTLRVISYQNSRLLNTVQSVKKWA